MDPAEAGKEVVTTALKRIRNKPKFFMLFSTIHYAKQKGGLETLVKAAYESLPPRTPLIGGTMIGFINNYGCYNRGVTGMAIYADGMDFAVGVGHNTKRNPEKAAQECANRIIEKLSDSKYKNKYFLSFISTTTIPKIQQTKGQRIVKKFIGIDLFLNVFDKLSKQMQVGLGRDDTVIKAFTRNLGDRYNGIGGATFDDISAVENYQFVDDKVLANSIVSVGISTNGKFDINTTFGLKPTGKKLRITKTIGDYIISEINNKPALGEFLRIMGWESSILDEQLFRKVFHYLLAQKCGKRLEPRLFAFVYGDSFVFPMKPNTNEDLEIYSSPSGEDLLKSYEELFNKKTYKNGLIISCGTRLETLGNKIFELKTKIFDKFIKGDYIMLFAGGEYSKIPNEPTLAMYHSNNSFLYK